MESKNAGIHYKGMRDLAPSCSEPVLFACPAAMVGVRLGGKLKDTGGLVFVTEGEVDGRCIGLFNPNNKNKPLFQINQVHFFSSSCTPTVSPLIEELWAKASQVPTNLLLENLPFIQIPFSKQSALLSPTFPRCTVVFHNIH